MSVVTCRWTLGILTVSNNPNQFVLHGSNFVIARDVELATARYKLYD